MSESFKKAVKYEGKGRMCIVGPSGSGKTYTALSIATAMGGKIAVVDTEHGSASKYADLFNFDVIEMSPPYIPTRYVEFIHSAETAGYDTVILDSLTHAWSGSGGLLEFVDDRAQTHQGNKFVAWKDATPIQNALIEALITAKLHVIATMRSKMGYVLDMDDKGKSKPRKVGMEPIQREGFEYEFDVFAEMTVPENDFVVTKSRCPELNAKVFHLPGKNVADIFVAWLKGQPAPPPVEKKAPPKAEPPKAPQKQIVPNTEGRPLSAVRTKAVLHAKAEGKGADAATEKQCGLLASLLQNVLGEGDKPRHLSLSWLWDYEGGSAKDLTVGQASATIEWLMQGSAPGEYKVNELAKQELLVVHKQAQADAGQLTAEDLFGPEPGK